MKQRTQILCTLLFLATLGARLNGSQAATTSLPQSTTTATVARLLAIDSAMDIEASSLPPLTFTGNFNEPAREEITPTQKLTQQPSALENALMVTAATALATSAVSKSTRPRRTLHTNTKRRFTPLAELSCPECSAKFTRPYNLECHIRTHTNERPFACETCGKRFIEKVALTTHTKTHTGEKKYLCSECNKGFLTRTNLTVHMRKHTDKKPYSCSQCNEGFTTQQLLDRHTELHSMARHFVCPQCKKGYEDPKSLRVHLQRVHPKAKPFDCSACGKSFTTQATLKTHSAIHLAIKPYICSTCNKGFTQKSNLKAHVTSQHEKKV